jgi:hypothetical protein
LVRVVLFLIDAFVALTACGGGIALALGLEGRRFPSTLLERTPFRSYVAPGVILATAVGGSAAAAAAALALSETLGTTLSAAAGAILCGWIAVEVWLLRRPSATEAAYLGLGAAMVALAVIA